MSERLVLISADGHAGPPIADYRPYVEPDWLEEFDRFVVAREAWRVERNRSMGLPEDGELVHALFGEAMVDAYTGQEAIARGGLLGVYDSAVRNAELEREGIVAEVLFADFQNSNEPPWGAAFPFPDTTPELRQAGARIFNRWLADFCGQLPGPAGRGGHRPATRRRRCGPRRPLGTRGRPGQRHAADRRHRVWPPTTTRATTRSGRRASRPGLPVTFHSGGTPWEGYGPHAMWVTKVEFMWWARRPLWELIFGGVFERFPDLRVAFTEQGADWIPSMLERLDEQYRSPFERGITDHLSLSPERVLGPQLLRRRVVHEPRRVRHPRPDRRRPDHVGRGLPPHRGHLAALAGRAARGLQRLHGRGDPADDERDRRRRLRLRPRRAAGRTPTGSGPSSPRW